ncbi:MAG TPA: hopanoid biosynthesis-associated RND transporter HpnN, partial [Rhodospirillaceae bacterium]|nr:hopanoid biosynthesis-associated RND transporter HpnN [Rhodospirillaceae bacterium]
EKEMDAAFPQKLDRLAIVVDGLNADLAESAAATLAQELAAKPDLFKTVTRPDSLAYFHKHGLLLMSEEELGELLDVLVAAQPMMGSLARDPSLRGLFETMALATQGVKHGQTEYKAIAPSFDLIAQVLLANLEGADARLPWQSMMSSRAPTLRDTRKFIMTQPVLDFTALSPGSKAREAVRALAQELKLTPENGVTVRMTGSVALNDEEFASVAEGTTTATIVSVVLVFALLYLALRSFRLIIPILITLGVGLVATTAFAIAAIGSLNLISVAFAVMFVGMAVDFGIQFGVRFRDEHHKEPDRTKAMLSTARLIAAPLSMAAAATIIGFIAFIPTSYRGVSELGLIAGAGMVIAFILNVTLLPALLAIFKPPAEPEDIGYAWAKPIDAFLIAHRKKLLMVTGVVSLVALVFAAQVRFDFDPLNLKNPDTESVSTLFDIMKDPAASPYVIQILAPSLDEAKALAVKIDALPEVDHTITLASFVPSNQEAKLALIADTKFLLDPTLSPEAILIPPSDEDNLAAMTKTAAALRALGPDKLEAQKLADALDKVVERDSISLLAKLKRNMIGGMVDHLKRVSLLLNGESATLDSITDDLRRDWITEDGRAKIEVYAKGDARDHRVLTAFTDVVRKVAPTATGAPISIQESGKTVSRAFIEAGALGILFISLLGWIVLRRARDVFLLIFPLILAGILTLATMKAINLPLNFANVIALPLLLSLGVSYAIYFITYWKNGQTNPLSSSMARAVLFSAGTTLVAFGSLSLSSHTGTRSMGELLTIALLYSLLCTFLVLPVLLGGLQSFKHSLKGHDSKRSSEDI